MTDGSSARLARRASFWAGAQVLVDTAAFTAAMLWLPALAARAGHPRGWLAVPIVNGALLTLAPLVWGVATNRWGPRPVLVLCGLARGVLLVLLAFSGSVSLLVANRALAGLMGGIGVGSSSLAIGAREKHNAASRRFAAVTIGSTAGGLCGPLVVIGAARLRLGLVVPLVGLGVGLAVVTAAGSWFWRAIPRPLSGRPGPSEQRPSPRQRGDQFATWRQCVQLAPVLGQRAADSGYTVILLLIQTTTGFPYASQVLLAKGLGEVGGNWIGGRVFPTRHLHSWTAAVYALFAVAYTGLMGRSVWILAGSAVIAGLSAGVYRIWCMFVMNEAFRGRETTTATLNAVLNGGARLVGPAVVAALSFVALLPSGVALALLGVGAASLTWRVSGQGETSVADGERKSS